MALKSIIAAGFVAATMAFLPVQPAEAGTKITVGIGLGGPSYSCWRHPRYCGWAPRPRYFYAPPRRPALYYYGYDYRRPVARKMSCSAARNLVDHSGFNRVNTTECRGEVYTFTGLRKGHRYVVKVDAFARRIVGTRRI